MKQSGCWQSEKLRLTRDESHVHSSKNIPDLFIVRINHAGRPCDSGGVGRVEVGAMTTCTIMMIAGKWWWVCELGVVL